MPLPLSPKQILAFGRDSRHARLRRPPILVSGVLADELARQLRDGGDASFVVTAGDPAEASAVVRMVAGAASPEDERVMRDATRALVPLIAVQTGDPGARLPYVLATEVVDAPPGEGLPLDEVVRALARALRRDGPALASSLPVLREAVEARRATEGTVSAGAIAMLARAGNTPHLPVISQAQMLSDITTTHGAEPPESPRATATTVAPPLVAAIVTSMLSKRLIERLPVQYRRSRLVEGVVAVAALSGWPPSSGDSGGSRAGQVRPLRRSSPSLS